MGPASGSSREGVPCARVHGRPWTSPISDGRSRRTCIVRCRGPPVVPRRDVSLGSPGRRGPDTSALRLRTRRKTSWPFRTARRYLRTGVATSGPIPEEKAISIRRRVALVDGEGEAPFVVAHAADPPPRRRCARRVVVLVPSRGGTGKPGHPERLREVYRAVGCLKQFRLPPPHRGPDHPRLHDLFRRGLRPPGWPPLLVGPGGPRSFLGRPGDRGQPDRPRQPTGPGPLGDRHTAHRDHPVHDFADRAGDPLRDREPHADGPIRPLAEETREARLEAVAKGTARDRRTLANAGR